MLYNPNLADVWVDTDFDFGNIFFELAGSQISRHTYAYIDFQNSRFPNSQIVKRPDAKNSRQRLPVPPYKLSHPNLTPFDIH